MQKANDIDIEFETINIHLHVNGGHLDQYFRLLGWSWSTSSAKYQVKLKVTQSGQTATELLLYM